MPCTALNLFCLCLDRLCLMFYYSSLSFERRPLNLSIKLNMNLSRLKHKENLKNRASAGGFGN
jgi:hypothetical protein